MIKDKGLVKVQMIPLTEAFPKIEPNSNAKINISICDCLIQEKNSLIMTLNIPLL